MKIGVVTTSYPRRDGDHAGSFVAAHVTALRGAGHQVDVIGAHTIASELFDRGGAPDQLERGGLRTYLAAARFSAALTREVSRHADSWDLIIAHWLAPSAIAALLGTFTARRTLPILAIAHGGDVHTLRRLGLLAPVLYALRARDVRLAFVSAELREIARRAAPRLARWLDRTIIQPMGIDVARFSALRATRAATERKTVLVVGRLVPVKGIDVAIEAMKRAVTDAHLVIAGEGPERARLESLAGNGPARSALESLAGNGPARSALESLAGNSPARAPLESLAGNVPARAPLGSMAGKRSISFLGAVDTTTRDRLLAEAACVIIPSRVLPNGRSEGTPMIALEALAAGVPVIASAVGGLRELPGITRVRPDDPRALAVAIDRLFAAPTDPHPIGLTAKLDWRQVSHRLLAHAISTEISGNREPLQPVLCESGDTSSAHTA